MAQTVQQFRDSLISVKDILSMCLDGVKMGNNKWASANCPFHDDNRSSFSINTSKGGWKCHTASCGRTGSLFQLPKHPNEPLATDIYEYHTSEGLTSYLKVRYFPKTFKTVGVNQDGTINWAGKNGKPDELYRWAEIKDKTGSIYLVEGEKDVDRLMSMGLLATTAGSSSTWTPALARKLNERNVILLPDNDPSGDQWMRLVCATLKPASILHIPEPQISDISEWLDSGYSLNDLKASEGITDGTHADTLLDLSTLPEPPPREDLWGSYIPAKCITILFADGGKGKSLFALTLAHHLVLGRPFLGVPTKPMKCLFLDWELEESEHLRRAYRISRGMGLERPPKDLFYYRAGKKLETVLMEVREEIHRKDIQFVVIDSMAAASASDMIAAGEIAQLTNALADLGMTVLIIDHQAKENKDAPNAATKPYGSVYKHNNARSVLRLDKGEPMGEVIGYRLFQFKFNLGKLSPPLAFKLTFAPDTIVAEHEVIE